MKVYLVNRNVTATILEHDGIIVAVIRNAAVFTSFSQLWVISENIWPSADVSRFA
jgi:hypothetical protein